VIVRTVDGERTRPLRRAVLRPTWPADAPMHGDDNPEAVHVAALDDSGEVLGACLIFPRTYPLRPDVPGAWQLRGMATVPAQQSQGIGAAVLAHALGVIGDRDGRLVWCEARTSARRFYERHGFQAEGPEYAHSETGIPHYRMWRPVPPG
jgi:ribosomal protein S18 acetylase RimI-like enzyme